MTIDTTVTNGRFVGPDGVFEHTISIHEGLVLDSPELEDVWRTIDASGHLVFPGMLQPGTLNDDNTLKLVRRGTTTVLLDGNEPVAGASIDHLSASRHRAGKPVIQVTDPDAIASMQSVDALLQVSVDQLTGTDSASIWDVVANNSLPVHVTHGTDPEFPLLQFLYHQGMAACGLTPSRIAAVTSVIPAQWFGVYPAKGSFQAGSHGDIVVFDPDTDDPYHDDLFPGRVIMSLQRGNMLLYNGQIHAHAGAGCRLPS
jgi:N-acyl-D-aspartate/D-glutamate deacylase